MSFNTELKKAQLEAQKAAERAIRATAIELLGAIIKSTPVDTGRLRGNWQTTAGAPPQGDLGRTDKSGSSSLAEAVTATANYNLDKTIYIANNLPYAASIENGSSSQAPQGMVKVNVAKFKDIVSEQARKNKE